MRNNGLYDDIIDAFQQAVSFGMAAERHKADGYISERKVMEQYGKRYIRRYYDQFGHPDRISGKKTSKKLYSVVKLDQLKAADAAIKGIVRFECKVIERERKTHKIQ